MQRRFIIQFLFQIGFLSLLLFISLSTLVIALGYYVADSESYHDLHTADRVFFESVIKQQGNDWQLNQEFKEAIKQQEGWLTLFDENGQLLYQYNVPPNEQVHYKLMLQNMPVVNTTFKTIEPFNKEPFIVAYSTRNEAAVKLQKISKMIDWSLNTLPAVQTDAIMYYLNADGTMLDALNPLSNELTINSVAKLQNEEQFETAAMTDEATGKTLIIAYEQVVWDDLAFFSDFKKPFFIGLAIVFLLLIMSTLFYAKKFGSPLLIMMKWVRQLGKKQYDTPINKKGQKLLFNKKGRIKRKYKLYKELFETLEDVAFTLKRNEEQQQLIEKTREEWISSLSHDLKTPLSSITGYVKMLQSDYEWTKEEQQQFYAVMDEKSDYMMALIEDLTLTYRLKNGQLPIYKDKLDVNEVIRRTIIQLMNNQDFKEYTFDFDTNEEIILVELDVKWLQRILDNLLINAIKHNPTGTAISIVATRESTEVIISICDDGVGMDEKTVEHLFNRYYRGTNTTESLEGTGLGMAITQQLILLQGGRINVHSEIGKGTCIDLAFPTTVI